MIPWGARMSPNVPNVRPMVPDKPPIYIMSQIVNALTLYLWSYMLTLKGQQIAGLCKSLTVNSVYF
jgi:hypothetical protein